jgi:predicted HTH domain antitoxin
MASKVKAEIEFPEDILISLKESKEEFVRNIKLYAAIELYKRKKLSLGKAAELVGMPRLEFADFLSKSQIPVLDLNAQELKREITSAKERASKH